MDYIKRDVTEFKDKFNDVTNEKRRIELKLREVSSHFNLKTTTEKRVNLDLVESEIDMYLEGIVYQNQGYLFTDAFIFYLVIMACNYAETGDKTYQQALAEILYIIVSSSKESLLFFFSSYISYIEGTVDSFDYYPPYIKKESNATFEEICGKLFNANEAKLMERFIPLYDKEIVKRTSYKQEQETAEKILSVIAAYCVVENKYDEFDTLARRFMDSCEEIIKKCELDGVAQMIDKKEFSGNLSEVITYILNIILEDNKKEIN